jgi:hypothetical protein
LIWFEIDLKFFQAKEKFWHPGEALVKSFEALL